jgi:hypothetical protein
MYGNREERAAADVQELHREYVGRKHVGKQLAPSRGNAPKFVGADCPFISKPGRKP